MRKRWVEPPIYQHFAERYAGLAMVEGTERVLIAFRRTGPWFAGGQRLVEWNGKEWVYGTPL